MESPINTKSPLKVETEVLKDTTLESERAKDLRTGFERELKIAESSELPPIKLRVFFSYHRTREDLKDFEKEFKDADIFIPEQLGWKKETLNYINNVSTGEEDVPEVVKEGESGPEEPFGHFMFKLLKDSHKPVTFIDIPAENHVYGMHEEFDEGVPIESLHSFTEYKKAMMEVLIKDTEFQRSRDIYMTRHLKEKILEVLENTPELKKKNPLKVLVQLGAFHTGFYHLLKEKDDIERVFSQQPFVFDNQHELQRRLYFGLPVDEDLLTKSIYELNLYIFLRPAFKNHKIFADSQNEVRLIRKLISFMETEPGLMEHLLEENITGEDVDWAKIFGPVFVILQEKGILKDDTSIEDIFRSIC